MKTKIIISTKRTTESSVMQFPISLERDVISIKVEENANVVRELIVDGSLDFTLQCCIGSSLYAIAAFTIPLKSNDFEDTTIPSMTENISINLLKAFNELFKIDILDVIALPFNASEWFDGYSLSKEFKNSLIMSKLPAAANIGETKELCGIKYFYDYDGWHPVNTNSII